MKSILPSLLTGSLLLSAVMAGETGPAAIAPAGGNGQAPCNWRGINGSGVFPAQDIVTEFHDLVDVVCVNRYPAWYSICGHPELAAEAMSKQLTPWHARFKKPIILSEFGADTIAGFHSLPSSQFSEEYQCEVFAEILRAIDAMPFVIGEHPWNVAEFATKQGINRVMGNRKGVFTRQRQPKAVAHLLRKRWHGIHDKMDPIGAQEKRKESQIHV